PRNGMAARRFERAQPIDAATAHAHQQPAAQRAARRLEVARLVPRLDEDVVHQILGVGAIAQHAVRDAEHGARVAVVEGREARVLAEADRGNEPLVLGALPYLGEAHARWTPSSSITFRSPRSRGARGYGTPGGRRIRWGTGPAGAPCGVIRMPGRIGSVAGVVVMTDRPSGRVCQSARPAGACYGEQ